MHYDEFIGRVQARSGLDTDHAEQASHSFFEMLGVFIKPESIAELTRQLPNELAETLTGTAYAHPQADAHGFFEHVGRTSPIGHRYSQAIWDTLKDALSEESMAMIIRQLPDTISRGLS